MIWLALLLLLLPDAAPAQTPRPRRVASNRAPAPPSSTFPLRGIEVKGTHTATNQQIIAAAGIKVGQSASKQLFEAARERLLASGAFDSVGYQFGPTPDGQGYIATLEVAEVSQKYPYRIEELPISRADAEARWRAISPMYTAEVPGTPAAFEKYRQAMQELAVKAGRTEKVIAKLTPERSGEYVLVFRPDKPVPTVSEIYFSGNQSLTQTALQNAIAGVGVGVPYSEPHFREILDTSVRPLYEKQGRLRVAFPKIETANAKDTAGLIVRVQVNEGPVYSLGKVELAGELPSGKESLLKTGSFPTGESANFTKINEGMERILQTLRRGGHLHAEAKTDRTLDDATKKLNLTVTITPGAQYTMGSLKIEGLDIQSEPIIRKMWGLPAGKPFNPEYPERFMSTVREQGVFDNLGKTRTATKIDEDRQTAEVTLFFR